MPKPPTYPPVIDQMKTFSSGWLQKRGLLKQGARMRGYTGWTSRRDINLDIEITTTLIGEDNHVDIEYFYINDKRIQRIHLESVKSNLGKSLIWYFICPYTLTRCRNLVFYGGYFMSRDNIENYHYTIQTQSHFYRELFQLAPTVNKVNEFISSPDQKNYKKYYNGKITKRYKRYLEIVDKWNSNSPIYRSKIRAKAGF